MLRSNINTDRSDFFDIKDDDHIDEVWQIMKKNIPDYFNRMIAGDDEYVELKTNGSFKVKTTATDFRKRLAKIFEDGLKNYKKEDVKYKIFFDDDSIQEFEDEDDPKAFKSALSTKVPVILKARNSKREMMHEWQTRFAASKPADVYSIFLNLVSFMNDFIDDTTAVEFSKYDDLYDLENLVVLNDDDDYNVPGVIGMGIKSSVLYFLNPRYFLPANKNTLYGFYFLTDCDHFYLPSRSNEFVMINDMNSESNRKYNRNMLIDQNYWYPYDLLVLYGLKAYRLLEQLCMKHQYKLNEEYRFVHLNTFMSHIWQMKLDTINTMMGGDQEDAK
ncbi:hypothetical protein [Pontibacter chitinilyticus]|uniref:hypothetical protein n=1 Tax=Pontibacter chitinilyticus TaxID=2674989 RepID=UPI00321AD961